MPEMCLVNKGRDEPLDALIQEARAHVELGQANADPLTAKGWSADDTTAMQNLTTARHRRRGEQRRARSGARSHQRGARRGRPRQGVHPSCETRFPAPFATRPWRA